MIAGLDVDAETLQSSYTLLSSSERERARRFVEPLHRRRFVVARARLRQLLGTRLGVPPESVDFIYGSHGKPALGPRFGSSRLLFNVSHREDVAVYAVATGRQVGIDVEAIRPTPDDERVAERYFSRHEYDTYLSLDAADRPLAFFSCWTRKEAFIKALGHGLSHPLDRFDVSLRPDEPAKILRIDDRPGDEFPWRLSSFHPAPGFVAALVTQ